MLLKQSSIPYQTIPLRQSWSDGDIIDRLIFIGFALSLIGIAITWLSMWEGFEYKIWGDRALFRAFYSEGGIPHMAAELSYSGRVPGSALYVIIRLVQLIDQNPAWSYVLQILLNFGAVLIVFHLGHRFGGLIGGSASGALYMTSIPIMQHLGELWNPGFVCLPASLLLFLSIKVFVDRQYGHLVTMFFVAGIGMQFHLGFIPYFLIILAPVVLTLNRHVLTYLTLGLAVLILTQGNYWLAEALSSFPNTTLITSNPSNSTSDAGNNIFDLFLMLLRKVSNLRSPVLPDGDFSLRWVDFIVILLINGLLSLSSLAAIWALVSKDPNETNIDQESKRFVIGLCAFYSVGTLLLLAFLAFGGHVRYVLSMVGALCLFQGIGFAYLVNKTRHFKLISSPRLTLGFLAVGFLAMTLHKSVYFMNSFPQLALHTYKIAREMISMASKSYNWTADDFLGRVSFSDRIENGAVTGFPVQHTFSYLTEHLIPKQVKDGHQGTPGNCLFVSPPENAARLINTNNNQIQLPGVEGGAQLVSRKTYENFTFFEYRLQSGNCLKNALNPYTFKSIDQTIVQNWAALAQPNIIDKKAIRIENTYLFRGGPYSMFGAAITVSQKLGRVHLRLDSPLLHGDGYRVCMPVSWSKDSPPSFGVWEFYINNPTVVFRSGQNGKTRTVRLHNGIIGKSTLGYLAPWFADIDGLSPELYETWFEGTVSFRCDPSGVPMKIQLGTLNITG